MNRIPIGVLDATSTVTTFATVRTFVATVV
jgi:hypothetical protein